MSTAQLLSKTRVCCILQARLVKNLLICTFLAVDGLLTGPWRISIRVFNLQHEAQSDLHLQHQGNNRYRIYTKDICVHVFIERAAAACLSKTSVVAMVGGGLLFSLVRPPVLGIPDLRTKLEQLIC